MVAPGRQVGMEGQPEPVSEQLGGAAPEETPAASAEIQPPPASTNPAEPPYDATPAFAPLQGDQPEPATSQPPPPRRRRTGRTLLIAGIIAIFLFSALGGAAAYANGQLTATYSPQRAVTDYFAAMGRGDVGAMMSNATFLPGAPAYLQFFGKDAVTAMMTVDQNRQISDVSVSTMHRVDDSTSVVSVSLSWGGSAKTLTYTVRKDPTRVHFLFYDSWRVEVPYTTITATLPNQAGDVQVDGLELPSISLNQAEVIQGYHQVTMLASDFYDESSQLVDGTGSTVTTAFPTTISKTAVAAAAAAVKHTFAYGPYKCDTKKYFNCPNHSYTVPAGYYEVLKAAGGDIDAYTSWRTADSGDPTANMVLVITDKPGMATASGACAMTLTVDGTKTYHFTGTWTANLTWIGGAFSADVTSSCDLKRA